MLRYQAHDRIVAWARHQARLAAAARRPRPRDSLATLMLGTLALGVGFATLAGTLAGIAGKPWTPWNEPRAVWTESRPRQYEEVWDPELKTVSRQAKLVVATTIRAPSSYCLSVALIGAALGGAGFALGMRRRRVSWVSTVGLVFSLLCPLLGLAHELVMNLLY